MQEHELVPGEPKPAMKSRVNPRTIVCVPGRCWRCWPAVPSSLRYAYQHGGFYLLSDAFLRDLPKRLRGRDGSGSSCNPRSPSSWAYVRAWPTRERAVVPYILGLLGGPRAAPGSAEGSLAQRRDADSGRDPAGCRVAISDPPRSLSRSRRWWSVRC